MKPNYEKLGSNFTLLIPFLIIILCYYLKMEYKAEFNKNKHHRRALSMARSQDQDSAGSQFFIALKDSNLLDEQYRVFGRVMSGMIR